MKKLFTFCILCLGMNVYSQIVVTPNPFNINSGNITLTYGPDYSLFDPLSDPNLYLYMGLDTDSQPSTWDYADDWNNVASLVPLTYNAGLGKYVANLNINTHQYVQGIPVNGMTVNNWYFIFRNGAGNRQSAGFFRGTDYGFQPTTFLKSSNFEFSDNEVVVTSQKVTSFMDGITNVEIFNLLGQKTYSFSLTKNEGNEFNLPQKGVYIAVISNGSKQGSVKFLN